MKIIILCLAITIASITGLVTGCTTSGVMDYSRIVDELKKGGSNIQTSGEVSQPFFSVKGKIIKVNNEDVQVFEYKDESVMETEASQVSPNGGTIGTTMVSWLSVPHFYKNGKIIVIYVGENDAIAGALEGVLGIQFAGG